MARKQTLDGERISRTPRKRLQAHITQPTPHSLDEDYLHANIPPQLGSSPVLKQSRGQKILSHLFIYGAIGVLLVGSFIIATPNPLNSLLFKPQDANTIASGKDLGLPKVCSMLDPLTAQEIMQDELLPYIETTPSTSTIICSYANKKKDKGISLIARKFLSDSAAREYMSDMQKIQKDTMVNTTIGSHDVLLEKSMAYIHTDSYVYMLQYTGFDQITIADMKTDIARFVLKLS